MRRSALVLAALLAATAPAAAAELKVVGQAGFLGEWELEATVTERLDNGAQQFVGPLRLTHVGLCTADGPEEKSGELRLHLSEKRASVRATLLIDGAECSYNGELKDGYRGVMSCPDRRAVPVMMWVKEDSVIGDR